MGLANNSLEVICKVWGAPALWTVIMANVKIMVDVITDMDSSKTHTQKLNSRGKCYLGLREITHSK